MFPGKKKKKKKKKTIETLEIDSTRWHRLENRDRERVMFEVLSRKYPEVDWKYANVIEVTKDKPTLVYKQVLSLFST